MQFWLIPKALWVVKGWVAAVSCSTLTGATIEIAYQSSAWPGPWQTTTGKQAQANHKPRTSQTSRCLAYDSGDQQCTQNQALPQSPPIQSATYPAYHDTAPSSTECKKQGWGELVQAYCISSVERDGRSRSCSKTWTSHWTLHVVHRYYLSNTTRRSW